MFPPSFLHAWAVQALHVIKAGFWQSYHWPTAVITKSMHSCFWLIRLGNVITKVCLIWGAQGPPCETCVFARAIPATLSSYPNRVLGHDSRCTERGGYCEWKMIKRGRNRWDFAWSSYFCLVILRLFLGFFHFMYVCPNKITDLEQCHRASDRADTVRVSAFICVAQFALRQRKGQDKSVLGSQFR